MSYVLFLYFNRVFKSVLKINNLTWLDYVIKLIYNLMQPN